MSVPNAFLGILTLGPAYGSQLQKELMVRAPHRRQLNAGQVYATLERLVRRRLIESAGATDDGLPLYRLTDAGQAAAGEWMSVPAPGFASDWGEVQDQILVTASLDSECARALVSACLGELERTGSAVPGAGTELDAQGGASSALAAAAARLHTGAVIEWLRTVRAGLDAEPELLVRARDTGRPRRGRRLSRPPGPSTPGPSS